MFYGRKGTERKATPSYASTPEGLSSGRCEIVANTRSL